MIFPLMQLFFAPSCRRTLTLGPGDVHLREVRLYFAFQNKRKRCFDGTLSLSSCSSLINNAWVLKILKHSLLYNFDLLILGRMMNILDPSCYVTGADFKFYKSTGNMTQRFIRTSTLSNNYQMNSSFNENRQQTAISGFIARIWQSRSQKK